MRAFSEMNPAAAALHLLLTACITIFCMEPLLLTLSLVCAAAFFVVRNGTAHRRFHLFAIGLPLLFALLNPLWNQHGTTVLFLINDRAITLEALYYGGVTGLRLAGMLYWFRNFSDLMTSEKLFYLFRFLSPRLALVFSMTVRHLALFRQQMRKIQQSQKALGLYREDHFIDDVRGGARVFSVLLTWALENGIITANSMAARGYGSGKRTSYVTFRMNLRDWVLLALTLTLGAWTIRTMLTGALTWEYYPVCVPPERNIEYLLGILSYALLAALPLIYEGKEAYTWYRLRSGISQ